MNSVICKKKMIQVYHNSRCGKSREAIKILENSGVEFEIIKYLENPPNADEINKLLKKLDFNPIELVRQKESIWIEKYKSKNLTKQDIVKALIEYPILIERPILIDKEKAIIARSPDKVNAFL